MVANPERAVRCPVCVTARPDRRWTRPTLPSTVLSCRSCGLTWCDPLPVDDSPSSSASAVSTDEGFTASMVNATTRRDAAVQALVEARHAWYAEDLGRTEFRLLEVGCGNARLAEPYRALGVDYVGVDLDPRPVAVAVERGVRGLLVGDLLEMPLQGPFDVIFASQVLEHSTRPRAFVERMAELLAPGGVAHVDVPNHDGLAGWPSLALGAIGPRHGGVIWPHHALAYRTETLERLFSPRFDVATFAVTPDHAVFGQGVASDRRHWLYYRLSGLLGAESLAVAYGKLPN